MSKGIKVSLLVVAIAIVVLGSVLLYNNWKNDIMTKPPKTPSNLIAEAITATKVNLTWEDKSNNELGFQIYRDGILIADLEENI